MVEYSDKRKNFRFPAFDDNTGVKLSTERERVLFAEELAHYPNQQTYNNEITYEERFFGGDEPVPTPEPDLSSFTEPMPKVQVPLPKSKYVPKKPTPLKRPDYSYQGPAIAERPVEEKKSAFHSEHRSSLENKRTGGQGSQASTPTKSATSNYANRNYFVPKHIPPSLAPDTSDDDNFDRNELAERMRKPKNSYMILAEKEDRPFQNEEIQKKEIIQFDTSEKKNETPFIRRDLNKVKRGEEDVPAITRKRAESQESSEQRNGRLEKSLSGIMAEETAQPHSNKYFD